MDTSILLDMALYGLDIIFTSTLRYFIVAGAAFVLCWIVLRERLRHRRIQARDVPRKKIMHDIRHSLVGLVSIATVTCLASVLKPLGYMKLYDAPAEYGWGYFVLSIAILFVLHDTYFYWTHRATHHKRVFKYVHKTHHRSPNPTPLSSYSLDWLDGMLQGLYLPMMAVLMPLNLWAVAVFILLMMLANTYIHLGYELLPKGWARHPVTGWIATSTYHNIHHQRSHCNYASYFTWWDRLMGTIHPDYVEMYEKVTDKPLLPEPTPVDLSPAQSFHGTV